MDQKAHTPDSEDPLKRGVCDVHEARAWLRERNVQDIECIVPDIAGVARGKMMPTEKFFAGSTLTMPSSIFAQTISGDYPEDDHRFQHHPTDGDLAFYPDYRTLTVVPWESDPTAQIIHDTTTKDGDPYVVAPRNLLKNIISMYEREGWDAVVAPEVEFYLIKPNTDPDYPLEPPIGRSGRPEVGRQSYSISALNEFDELIDDIYDLSEAQGLEIDTLIHEEGAAQMEINLRHGDPLELSDQVFLFKRTIREAALRHEMYATFMAKPMSSQPGSAMHIHQSIQDKETGQNIFSNADGEMTDTFRHFVGGLQTFLPALMPIMAPYVNSYRRFMRNSTAPTNVYWGQDNRTVGLRMPNSNPAARRIENRLPGSDANPYLAIAATMAAGYLGIKKQINPSDPKTDDSSNQISSLPRSLLDAVAAFENNEDIIEIFGEKFVSTYRAIKLEEHEIFMSVISPWEREYLLLNV
ncbi:MULTISPECIES: glutamine synthetase family protein [Pseudovibrio]|uniref:glutamine synthetase family protein n=1 Tax=Stappiaceae TaxID=2821832 RepID=UPI00236548FC|nr:MULTISPECIES: glutamine synthetase family protein [Pseudovibrio]MDD7912109.1 glutamine synthetase family protein [Pseudovibrio exalbescens]MDX5592459.1 glutamine synthetase family protein [Pseudovibrio sp. SPO723]